MAKLIRIGRRIINLDMVTFAERLDSGAVKFRFDTAGETPIEEHFSPEQGNLIWPYLLSVATDVHTLDLTVLPPPD